MDMQSKTERGTVGEIEARLVEELATSRQSTADAVRLEMAINDVIDSLEGVELAITAEVAFGVRIADSELPAISSSVHKLAELIAAKMAVAAGSRGGSHARD